MKPGDSDPVAVFENWFEDAKNKEPNLPEAAALGTANKTGMPSVRMVLLKAFDDRGFVFYTNMNSRKASDIRENDKAALCFHWKSVARQVRVEGDVEEISDREADGYFASRPRGAQIGAWASKQSEPMKKTLELERQVAKYMAKFKFGEVPRPEFWSGYRISPKRIEFWQEGKFRLHERVLYIRHGQNWRIQRLYP